MEALFPVQFLPATNQYLPIGTCIPLQGDSVALLIAASVELEFHDEDVPSGRS
jgi:hypothetical protein